MSIYKKLSALFVLTCGSIFFFFVLPVSAAITKNTSIQYYDVSGNTAAKLGQDVFNKMPDHKHPAMIVVTFRASWQIAGKITEKNKSYYMSPVDVTLSMKFIYPRWKGYNTASPALKKKWDIFISLLREHEETHAQICRESALKMEKAFLMGPYSDYWALKRKGLSVKKSIVAETKAKNDAYDKVSYMKIDPRNFITTMTD